MSNFTSAEQYILNRSSDLASTRRRIVWSILIPVGFVILLLAMFLQNAEPRLLLWLFVIYIVIGVFEKISFGFAVLSYKRTIQKLLAGERPEAG